MWAVVVLAIVGLANSASVERRALTPMTGYQLDSKALIFPGLYAFSKKLS